MKRNDFYSRLVLFLQIHMMVGVNGKPFSGTSRNRSTHFTKGGRGYFSYCLAHVLPRTLHPYFAESPGKLLAQVLSKAVILYFFATADAHAVMFVDSCSLKEVKERNVLSIPEYCLASWPKMKRQRTSTDQHTFLWFAPCCADTGSREMWRPGYKMITILPCSVCILPLFPEAITAHLFPQSVALLET